MFRFLPRKWIVRVVVIVLLSIAIAVSYSFWQRRDARFVGKWNVGLRCRGETQVTPWGVIEFRYNGTAVMQESNGTGATIPFPWREETSKLTFGEKSKSNPGLIEKIRSDLRYLWSGSTILGLDEATYDILLMTPGNVELLAPGDDCSFVMSRILE